MRYNKKKLKANRNKTLPIEFVKQAITSFSGLQLIKHYICLIGLYHRIKDAFKEFKFSGDYDIADLIIMTVLLKFLGLERISHIDFIKDDPLFKRISGLTSIPHRTTITRALAQFTSDALKALIELNGEIVMSKIDELGLKRLTIDIDGSVISTKGKAAFALKGYNPIKKGANSYFPLTAHIGETGHFISIINRSGANHDSNRALNVIRSILQKTMGYEVRFRTDSAFCIPEILDHFLSHSISFAIKAPFWKLNILKESIQERKRWNRINNQWSYFWIDNPIDNCEYEHRGLVLRKKIKNPERNFQLDLFSPNNGIYEYSCIVTDNSSWNEKDLLDFVCGRSAQENSISELKSDFHFDNLIGNSYQANSANIQLSQMAYNLMISMQIDSGLAKKKKKSKKHTRLFKFMKMKTLRYLVIYKAGKIVFHNGKKILNLTQNASTQKLYGTIISNLKMVA